jgi:hypothetical protein
MWNTLGPDQNAQQRSRKSTDFVIRVVEMYLALCRDRGSFPLNADHYFPSL